MGKDNQPKHRQKARDIRRSAAVRQPYQRILILSEGTKTEPRYLNEIRTELRLSTAHVQVQPGGYGTDPLSLVVYAESLFRKGDRARGIEATAFDQVFIVFDRDDHATYHPALAKAAALDGKLRNDERKHVPVQAIASVPCFEVWLLMHFEDVQAPVHRDDVYRRLRAHLPGYEKGQGGHWAKTKHLLGVAAGRAAVRAAATTAHDGAETFTDLHRLVSVLIRLKE
jgi:hypothetical protein